MARSQAPDDGSEADAPLAAVVRRLGSIERHLDQVATRLSALEASVDAMSASLDTQLPRVQRETVATAAMVDAVAAQVAADTDSIMRRLDRLDAPASPGPSGQPGFWQRLWGAPDPRAPEDD